MLTNMMRKLLKNGPNLEIDADGARRPLELVLVSRDFKMRLDFYRTSATCPIGTASAEEGYQGPQTWEPLR